MEEYSIMDTIDDLARTVCFDDIEEDYIEEDYYV